MGCIGGELLLAKVKNASGRIGIFENFRCYKNSITYLSLMTV